MPKTVFGSVDEFKDYVKDSQNSIEDCDVSKLSDLSGLFKEVEHDNWTGIEDWYVSYVTNMSHMFEYSNFNGLKDEIIKWDASSVINMDSMFFRNNEFRGISADGI